MIVWWDHISCGLWGEGGSPNIWWPRNRFYGEVVGGAMGRPGVGWLLSIMGWWRGSVEYYGGHTLSLAWVSRCWTHTRNPLTGGGSPLVGWWNQTGVAIFLQNIGETVLFWGKRKATKAAIGFIFFVYNSVYQRTLYSDFSLWRWVIVQLPHYYLI